MEVSRVCDTNTLKSTVSLVFKDFHLTHMNVPAILVVCMNLEHKLFGYETQEGYCHNANEESMRIFLVLLIMVRRIMFNVYMYQ